MVNLRHLRAEFSYPFCLVSNEALKKANLFQFWISWCYLKHQWTLIVFILRHSAFWPNSVSRLLHVSYVCCIFAILHILRLSPFSLVPLTYSLYCKFKLLSSKLECSLDSSLLGLEKLKMMTLIISVMLISFEI